MCVYVKTQIEVVRYMYIIYVYIIHMYVCVNMHLHIYQKISAMNAVSPHYTRLRGLLPLRKGQGTEIQVMVNGIFNKSNMFYFFLKQWLETNISK